MSGTRNPAPRHEDQGALPKLTPLERSIADIKALLVEAEPRGAFLDYVRGVRIQPLDGRAWNLGKLEDVLGDLRRKKILTEDLAIEPRWIEPLTLDILARPDGATLIRSLKALLPRSAREGGRPPWGLTAPLPVPVHDIRLARAIRLALLLNDEAEVTRLAAVATAGDAESGFDLDSTAIILAASPCDPGFVERLTPALRVRLAHSRIVSLIDFGVLSDNGRRLIERARSGQLGGTSPELTRALLRLDVMAERPQAAGARIEQLRPDDPIAALAAEGSLAFLAGRNDEALVLFREALKRRRKALGKRKLALPDEAGLFHLLALFATGEASLQDEIEALLPAAAARSSGLDEEALAALGVLLDLAAGRDVREAVPALAAMVSRHPLGTAIVTLVVAVIDGPATRQREAVAISGIEHWGAELVVPARIMLECHARFADRPAAWTGRMARLGPGLGRSFLEIVPVRAPWERSFARLEALIGAAPAKPAAPARAKRLVFLLDAETGTIAPQEQTAKAGGWTGGRPVALKRLHQRDAKLDYLTPADLEVVATLQARSEYWSGRLDYDFEPRLGLLALIGHPLVFDAASPDRQVELIRYPAELIVREGQRDIIVTLSHVADAPKVFIEAESPTRWRIVDMTKALVELCDVLTPQGLKIPKSARERVIGLIRAENPLLPIRSELTGVEGEAAPGDATPILQLAPIEDGLVLRALIRPAGRDGPVCPPGTGARSILVAGEGGRHRRVNRDLAAEGDGLDAILAACPALAPWRQGDHDWRIESFEAALDALQEIEACPAPLQLEWPEGAAIRPTRTIEAKSLSLAITSARDWFEIGGSVTVDDDLVLDMADLIERLGQARGRFVPLGDGRFLALTEDLKRRLEGFAAVTEAGKGGRRIGAAGALAVQDLVDAAGKVDAAKSWRALIERIDAAQRFAPRLPAGFEAELRDYQMDGYIWLARLNRLGLGACLADDMGLGKTVQSLALLLAEAGKGPSLVVAPTSVCHNWQLEAARFAPGLAIHVLAAAKDRKALVEALGPGDVLVASYGLLAIEAAALSSRHWVIAVFDEAQNLKNAETRRAQASKTIEAGFRLALSGTPVENRLDELWSLFDTVAPGLLGSREGFQRRFAVPIERTRSASARQALKQLLKPFLLRRTKAAVLAELPPRTEIVIEIEPGEEERAFYEALRRRALDSLAAIAGDGGQKRIHILAEITRLRRAACHPALIDERSPIESAKLAQLMELVQELRANRHRALVFSQFTSYLDKVEAALTAAGIAALRLDGSTPVAERARLVAAFQRGEGELFLLSLKAGARASI
jgi:superfamily II DNA or RNA helicase